MGDKQWGRRAFFVDMRDLAREAIEACSSLDDALENAREQFADDFDVSDLVDGFLGDLHNELSDAVYEQVDGSAWVIYTHANYRAMKYVSGDPIADYRDEYGEAPESTAVIAYHACQGAVWECMNDVAEEYLREKCEA